MRTGGVVLVEKQKRTVASDPFHNIDVLGQHDNCLEIARHEGCVDKRAAQIEWLGPARSSV